MSVAESRVAAVQMRSGMSVDDNLSQAAQHVAQAAEMGAELIVLPEGFAMMALDDGNLLALGEPDGDGPLQEFLASLAARHRVWLVGGTIPITCESGEKVHAASLVYSADGERVARYDKVHLFDAQVDDCRRTYQESRVVEPGDELVALDTPVGRLGLSVCYDLRFPELFRRLLDRGVDLVAVPSAFTAVTGHAHWEVLVRARAIENQCYVVAAAQGGRHDNGRETHGYSMIVDPWGEIVANLQRAPGVIAAALSRARLAQVRQELPALRHRRSLV